MILTQSGDSKGCSFSMLIPNDIYEPGRIFQTSLSKKGNILILISKSWKEVERTSPRNTSSNAYIFLLPSYLHLMTISQ